MSDTVTVTVTETEESVAITENETTNAVTVEVTEPTAHAVSVEVSNDQGPVGPAPAGTGLVSVTAGALDTPTTLSARVAADAANLRTQLALGTAAQAATGDFAAAVHTHADKADLSSPTFTGTPAAPTAGAGTNSTQIATTAYVVSAVPYARYTAVNVAFGSFVASRAAAKCYFQASGVATNVDGVGSINGTPNMFYLTAADFPTVNGKTTVLRVKGEVHCNDTQPHASMTYVFGLYPVTRPAISGAATYVLITMGTVVEGSTCTVSQPAADSSTSVIGTDFAIPADGWYCLGVVTNQTHATNSFVTLRAELQMRNP